MGNISRKKEILKKGSKGVLEMKKIKIKEMNAFYGLISGTDMDKERISELAEMLIETPKLKYKEEKKSEHNIH